jgi:hypothetical protein
MLVSELPIQVIPWWRASLRERILTSSKEVSKVFECVHNNFLFIVVHPSQLAIAAIATLAFYFCVVHYSNIER